jgi:hypothetical protein
MDGIVGAVTDHLGATLAGWVTLASAVVATVEGLSHALKRLKKRKAALALLLGPVFGALTYWVSNGALVDVPLHGAYAPQHGDELRHLVGAGLLGLFSTALGMKAHDWLLNPVLRKLGMKK